MKAIYVTYEVATGTIKSVQVQHCGLARKVADMYRCPGESIVRFSTPDESIVRFSTPDLNFDEARLLTGRVDAERNLVLDDVVVLTEDTEHSVVETERIQDE